MNSLAPIGISTYARVNHLKQTVKALQDNFLAKESELYIFSDAPMESDVIKVNEVREYANSVEGFKNVYVIERKTNSRVENNRQGMKQLLDQYGKMIFLEEDIVTAPGFLAYMNEALDFYEPDKRVLSITGYCPPIAILKDTTRDVFILQRFNAWGFATWSDRFDPFGFDVRQHGVDLLLTNKKEINKFMRNGKDMYPMLISEYHNEIDALDIKLMYYEFVANMFTVYPLRSLVQNIGHDGSGIHCVASDKYHHDSLWEKSGNFVFDENIQVDERIRLKHYEFRSIDYPDSIIVSFLSKLRRFLNI